jgi:hypothetical protein
MSNISQEPEHEIAMNTGAHENHFQGGNRPGGGRTGKARLQAIHDLVRSGDYHVPAAAIADRMVERLIAEKRRPTY